MRTFVAAALLVAVCLPSFADPTRRQLGQFSTDGSVKEAVAALSKQSGVPIVFAEGVEKTHAKHLGQPVRMVMRGSTVGRLLDMLLAGSTLVHVVKGKQIVIQPAKKAEPEGLGEGLAKREGGPDAVLVVEFVRKDTLNYSGFRGAKFWFKVLSVKRYDETAKMAKFYRDSYTSDYAELKKRSTMLDRYHLLEANITYRGADKPSQAKIARLTKLLAPGKKYVLATSTTVVYSTLGTVVEGKWGAVRGMGTHLWPHTDATLRGIDDLFIARRKQHAGEELDVTKDPTAGVKRPRPPGGKPGGGKPGGGE